MSSVKQASINFLDLNVKFSNGKLLTSLYVKSTDFISTFTFNKSSQTHKKVSSVTKIYEKPKVSMQIIKNAKSLNENN